MAASTIEQMQISRGPEIDRLLAQSQLSRNESGIKLELLLGTESSRDSVFVIYSRVIYMWPLLLLLTSRFFAS